MGAVLGALLGSVDEVLRAPSPPWLRNPTYPPFAPAAIAGQPHPPTPPTRRRGSAHPQPTPLAPSLLCLLCLLWVQAEGFSEAIIDRFFRPFLGGIFFDRSLGTSSRLLTFVMRMLATGALQGGWVGRGDRAKIGRV